MEKKQIGIIGAGVMGRGVAQSFAQGGYEVVLLDNREEAIQDARVEIASSMRMKALYDKGWKAEDRDKILARISFALEYELLKDADFIVENVSEKIEVKKSVYQRLNGICKADCILAANTSCISITQLASFLNRPEQVIGIHFMNPVPLIPAVEVIKGYHTSEETVETTRLVLESIGKEAIVVKDFPGFVSNRISHLMMNEAAFIIQDQVAAPWEIDEVFKKCYGHKMGPLETADLIGLDTVKNSLEVLYESYQDPKFRCCPLLKKMVDAGLLGKKSGKGFYDYTFL